MTAREEELTADVLAKAEKVSHAVHLFWANPAASPNDAINDLVLAVDRRQAFYDKQIDEGH